ncbi:unnamed protein product [Phaedon cochleariae]|uniref:CDP-diacylglycerol--glycerol-3-phosphate 3-phosphatidyltransferase n=1 Tax=Phaedon cochleariae TaxID=80249 RepID=A0A9P0DGH1_PHACE|nr:unnamed protein product [Phaedon cochleariae]
MIRRLLSGFIDNVTVSLDTQGYHCSFTKKETIPFGWLSSAGPCFPITAKNISILTDPKVFYEHIIAGCKNAKNRITLVSLYLGNGSLERKIVDSMKNNAHFMSSNLDVNILLDYTRGSRYENNSRKMLLPLLQEDKNCRVSLYHTPALRGLLKRYMPNRWNELLGLQHMKLYIFDDTLIISGANLSNDYFTNRQDRYFIVKDKQLCDFYCGLVNRIQMFSLNLDKNDNTELNSGWTCSPFDGNKREFIQQSSDIIRQYFLDSQNNQSIQKEGEFDTWIFPLIQMGQLGVDQDAQVTNRILAEAPAGSKLKIASGYFNLTTQYMDTLIRECQAQCDILMAHPKANGFWGSTNPSGGIPYAYSLIAKNFEKYAENEGQLDRIRLLEYLQSGWTFHVKGLWYYPPENTFPSMTVIGSPNFGERSVKRDLETQIAIVTENEKLRESLHMECSKLFESSFPAETKRKVPLWVNVFVLFFRSYF